MTYVFKIDKVDEQYNYALAQKKQPMYGADCCSCFNCLGRHGCLVYKEADLLYSILVDIESLTPTVVGGFDKLAAWWRTLEEDEMIIAIEEWLGTLRL